MRKRFKVLGGVVRDEMNQNLMGGDAFIFMNRGRMMMQVLVWDRTGFVIYYKRLERGTFDLPRSSEDQIEIE